jgi:hypothetical protein
VVIVEQIFPVRHHLQLSRQAHSTPCYLPLLADGFETESYSFQKLPVLAPIGALALVIFGYSALYPWG